MRMRAWMVANCALAGVGLLVAAAGLTFGNGAALLVAGLALLALAAGAYTHLPEATDSPTSTPVRAPTNDRERLAASQELPPAQPIRPGQTVNVGRRHA